MARIPTISVVVPMYNEAGKIGRCLDALSAQDRKPMEIIVVDNNSTDTSADLVRHFARYTQGLKVMLGFQTRPGPAAARNKGIELASGDVIAFTDADCIPDTQWIRQITDCFSQDETLGAVGGVERPLSEASTLVHRVVSATWLPPAERLKMRRIVDRDEWLTGVFISTFNCAIRRSWLEEIQGFDETFYPCGEDMDLWFRALDKGAKVVAWHPDIIVEHQQTLPLRALLRKMFFYGEALAHITGQHFRGRFFILSRWLGVQEIPVSPWTGIIWNQAVIGLPVLLGLAMIASVSWSLIPLLIMMGLGLLAWKLKRSMAEKGFIVDAIELPLAVGIYCLRTIARELGLCFGSFKYRVLCI